MTLRARLAITLFVVLVGPALVGAALLAGALPIRAPAGTNLAASTEALQMAIEVRCRSLTATAQALAVTAGVRGDPIVVSPSDAPGPWALCDAKPGPPALPQGTRYAGLAARAEIRDRAGDLTGYAYAVQALDADFLRQLSIAAGAQVLVLAIGETPDSWQLAASTSGPVALPLALAKPPPVPRPDVSILLAVTATAALIAGTLSWWLAGIATRPLAILLAAVERVVAGDLTVRSRVDGRDETGRLGRGLDRLISGMQETQRLAVTDPLTGLGNVRHLGDSLRLEAERASRFGRSLGVLVLDLDHFKSVNDGFGHRAGDAVLVEFAVRIRRVIREVDLAFRQGGEEFVILLPETDLTGSLTAARRIGEAVREEPFRVRRRRGVMEPAPVDLLIPVTVSIGVAVMPRHAITASEVLDAADEALYAAKKAGRDTYVLASVCLPEQRVSADGGMDSVRGGGRGGEAESLPYSLPGADAGGASGGTTSPRTPVGG